LAIGITEVRPGTTIEIDGQIFLTVEYQHVKMAQRAWVRTKLKNLRTGAIFEKTFNVDEKVERAHIDRREMQYLYHDEDFYYFMDKETFDQISIPIKKLGDSIKYMIDGAIVPIS
jgi:elongation factor P